MKDVKIVIGANYGDEGKGLMTRHFVLDAKAKAMKPIVIFSNGTAQRGHTVDYSADNRHIYHHFGSGTGDKASTYFAKTFLIHPMEYHREYNELIDQGIIPPFSYFDPEAKVITPFDMVVDHATEEWIAIKNGEREFGSCGFGSWCAAEDRIPMGRTAYSIVNFMNMAMVPLLLEEIWKDCLTILTSRNVDLEKTSFAHLLKDRTAIINNFICDLEFFFRHSWIMPFDILFNSGAFDSFIFENGQGLGLDMSIKNEWHTTSNTGIINPYNLLRDKKDFSAEICYVTRSYLTRHGVGPMEEMVQKKEINSEMNDKTNVYNDFQGDLRYGYLNDADQQERIRNDFSYVSSDSRFNYSMAVTHTNEFNCGFNNAKYYSDNPYGVIEKM